MKELNKTLDQQLDEILYMAFVGLYGKQPDDTGMDFHFVPMEDSYGVLKNGLKEEIKALLKEVLATVRPEEQKIENGGLAVALTGTQDLYKAAVDSWNQALAEYDENCRELGL